CQIAEDHRRFTPDNSSARTHKAKVRRIRGNGMDATRLTSPSYSSRVFPTRSDRSRMLSLQNSHNISSSRTLVSVSVDHLPLLGCFSTLETSGYSSSISAFTLPVTRSPNPAF